MKKPIIGVVPLYDKERESLWMLPGYFGGIEQAGGLPVMLPLTADEGEIERISELCDGLLFTGGQDVEPALYGEQRLPLCGDSLKERDELERALLFKAIERSTPVLGICRGIQFINAALGGTLWQDLPSQTATTLTHCQRPPYDRAAHSVELICGSPLHALIGREELQVNSYHHQGVKALAPSLRTMAEAPDGLIEAVYLPDSPFIWAVQWHPECSYKSEESSRLIFSAFVRAAEKQS